MLLQREARSSVDDAIDLTSMVDVVFQLLIFLMITYQASSNAEVELPEAAHGIGVEENLATILTLVPAPVPGDPVLVYDGASTDESARLADDEAIAEAVRGGLSPRPPPGRPPGRRRRPARRGPPDHGRRRPGRGHPAPHRRRGPPVAAGRRGKHPSRRPRHRSLPIRPFLPPHPAAPNGELGHLPTVADGGRARPEHRGRPRRGRRRVDQPRRPGAAGRLARPLGPDRRPRRALRTARPAARRPSRSRRGPRSTPRARPPTPRARPPTPRARPPTPTRRSTRAATAATGPARSRPPTSTTRTCPSCT